MAKLLLTVLKKKAKVIRFIQASFRCSAQENNLSSQEKRNERRLQDGENVQRLEKQQPRGMWRNHTNAHLFSTDSI